MRRQATRIILRCTFFFSSRRRHTSFDCDWSSDVCSSDLPASVPSTFATGYLYAGLGYPTAFDAAIPPLAARHAHEEFHDTPVIDKGFLVLFGNNHYVMKQIAAHEPERLRAFVAWLLASSKGYGVKL